MDVFALIPDQALITLNTVELVAIFYLARGLSRLSERIAKLEGKSEQRDHNHQP
jgi:hypothetical protein